MGTFAFPLARIFWSLSPISVGQTTRTFRFVPLVHLGIFSIFCGLAAKGTK